MVELDVQFLAGVAITFFLALIFFGVIVLWDVALAIRSLGDKLDKLEDSVDDDLSEIGYSLDRMSDAQQGGGGTQLHLRGGTISSGPTQPGEGQPQAQPEPPGGHEMESQVPPQASAQQHGSGDVDNRPSSDVGHGTDRSEQPEATETDREQDNEDQREVTETDRDESDGPEPETETQDETEVAEDDERDEPDSIETDQHRVAVNRNRFITSPDRTPWYAVRFDHDTFDDQYPEISGELESALSEIDSSSRDEQESTDTTERGESVDDTDDDSASRPDDEEPIVMESPSSASTAESESYDSSLDDREDSSDSNSGLNTDIDDTRNERGESSGTVLDFEEASTDELDSSLEVEPTDDVRTQSPGNTADEMEPASPTEPDHEVDSDDPGDEEPTEEDDENVPPDGAEELDFEVIETSDDEEDVTVEEALERMNDDAPSLSLSSHPFEVTARSDAEGAVLVFEFEPESVDFGGSTKRLLRYQMRSYADQDTTPEGTVRFDQNRIVIEIPDADGNAISHWGEAAVSIIDRTLYLSDDGS